MHSVSSFFALVFLRSISCLNLNTTAQFCSINKYWHSYSYSMSPKSPVLDAIGIYYAHASSFAISDELPCS
jgi:hypothetical protein